MAFKETDKILVNRDGVDYQADVGPLMGGGDVDLDIYYTKKESDSKFMPKDLRTLPALK